MKVPARAIDWFIFGESIADVKSTLVRVLKADLSLVALPIVDPIVRLGKSISNLTSVECDLLEVQKKWKIEDSKISPAGAVYYLNFESGRLSKISYARDRIDWK